MNILVTGAGGYVGSVLCRKLLDRGYNVYAIDNFHKHSCDALIPLAAHPFFQFRECDITDRFQLKSVVQSNKLDAVIHLAAIVGFPQCEKQKLLAQAVNVDGTYNLVEYLPKECKFVFASTGSVYGKIEELCTEETFANPQSLYGRTKLTAESIIRTKRPHYVIYRFMTGFGLSPKMRVNLLVNDLVWQAVFNHAIVIFEGQARRTFVHVQDMARALIHAVENYDNMSNNVYNIGDDSMNITKINLAKMVQQYTNCYIHEAEIGEDQDKRDYEVCFSKINQTGWKCQIGLQQGVEELVKVSKLLRTSSNYD